jgi:ribose 5-phosphate isomerase B
VYAKNQDVSFWFFRNTLWYYFNYMKVYFATDHAGYELKNALLAFVRDELGFEVQDCGAHEFNADDDYTDFVSVAAEHVSKDPENSRAIVLGGSGQGEAMCANRFPGVRATTYYAHNPDIIALSREHNNANVLSLGARFLSPDEAKEAVRAWLSTPFTDEERHVRRIAKLG